jgi:hypothetical protein
MNINILYVQCILSKSQTASFKISQWLQLTAESVLVGPKVKVGTVEALQGSPKDFLKA